VTGERRPTGDPPNTTERSADDRTDLSRRDALGGLAAAGSLALAGCAGVVPRDVIPDLDEPELEWRVNITAASQSGLPAVGDGLVLVGAQDKSLHGFETTDATRAFEFETGGPIESRPAVPEQGGPFHVHGSDGDLYTVDRTGEQRWHVEGVDSRGRLARAGSLLVSLESTAEESVARGFDAETGEVRFEQPTGTFRLDGLSPELFAVPVPTEGDRERLSGLSPADGSVRWSKAETTRTPSPVADGDLIVMARGDRVTGYEPEDGSVRWETEIRTDSYRPPVLGSQVYVRQEDDDRGGLAALDRATGEVRWEASPGQDIRRISAAPNAVFVGSRADDPDNGIVGRVDCFELNGTRRWATETKSPDPARLPVVGDLVVLASGRSLVGLSRSGGEAQWTHEPESRMAVTTGDDSLFVSYIDKGAVAKLPTT
jgi:outer membrane protein assembly factor BamB